MATDLRVSLTDRCNLRCTYCMPAEGLEWLPSAEVLTDEEILRLVAIGVQRLGITTVRLTGGEPLLRKNLEQLVAGIAALSPDPDDRPDHQRHRAWPAGPRPSPRPDWTGSTSPSTPWTPTPSPTLTRRRRLDDVLAGVRAARAAGLDPVKINSVLMRGVNDHEALAAVALGHGRGGAAAVHRADAAGRPARLATRSTMVTAAEIRTRLSEEVVLVEDAEDALTRGSAPAELFRVVGTDYSVGIIASVSKPFCGACDRVRLTADGQVRNCLFARTESDLRTPLRARGERRRDRPRWVLAVAGKQAGHGIDDPSFLQPDRPMSAIGG